MFTAVLEATEASVAARIAAAASGAIDPCEALRLGCRTWLALAASEPAVRRIVLIDAPSVIGWQAWRAMDDRYSLGLLRGALTAAAENGQLRTDRVDLYAHMLLAVLIEVSLMIARAPGDPAVAEAGHDATDLLLRGMLQIAPVAAGS